MSSESRKSRGCQRWVRRDRRMGGVRTKKRVGRMRREMMVSSKGGRGKRRKRRNEIQKKGEK